MAVSELEVLAQTLAGAKRPEDVFGTLPGTAVEMLEAANMIYRRLSKAAHPDGKPAMEQAVAEAAFKRLQELWEQAQERIARGTYGTPEPTKTVAIKGYEVGDLLYRGDIANLYSADAGKRLFKVARASSDNDLLANEARVLKQLSVDNKYAPFLPSLIESFRYKDSSVRQANVFAYSPAWYNLVEVREQYPAGLDPRDMAWMWRRLLYLLDYVARSGAVHGAVLPMHILVEPEQHGLMLVGWSATIEIGKPLRIACSSQEDWYPVTALKKGGAKSDWDIAMGSRCMLWLTSAMPIAMQRYFRGCMLGTPGAAAILEEFDMLLERLYGPRKFRAFAMPKRQ